MQKPSAQVHAGNSVRPFWAVLSSANIDRRMERKLQKSAFIYSSVTVEGRSLFKGTQTIFCMHNSFLFCDNLIFFRCIFMIKTWSRCFWEGKQARKSKIPFSAWSWIKNKFKLYKTKKVVHNNPWINVANKWINKKIRIFCYDRTFFAINWLQLIMKRWSQLPYMEESEVSNQREIYSKSN